jgi:MtfA peptidase
MVGWGVLQNQMLLSQQDLRAGFLQGGNTLNTGIHEFVHLIDKTDGATDGIPENIMDKQYIIPWLNLMQKEIQKITDGQSSIHPYGATSGAEFFAVASEYFFERPDLLKTHHPELYDLLDKIFNQRSG